MTRQYDVSRSSELSQKNSDNWILQRTAVRSLPAKTLTPQAQSPVGDRSGNQLDLMQIPVSDRSAKPSQLQALAQSDRETPVQRQEEGKKAENNTGLPDRLKEGIESLSGYDLSGVRVNYNSPKPAQLNAHAYTQGQAIEVAPGQERHLPHEAWHVVQQMQGRVRPTMEVNGYEVNGDSKLEGEADVMGKRAVQMRSTYTVGQLMDRGRGKPQDEPGTSTQNKPIVQRFYVECEADDPDRKSTFQDKNTGQTISYKWIPRERDPKRYVLSDKKTGWLFRNLYKEVPTVDKNIKVLTGSKKNEHRNMEMTGSQKKEQQNQFEEVGPSPKTIPSKVDKELMTPDRFTALLKKKDLFLEHKKYNDLIQKIKIEYNFSQITNASSRLSATWREYHKKPEIQEEIVEYLTEEKSQGLFKYDDSSTWEVNDIIVDEEVGNITNSAEYKAIKDCSKPGNMPGSGHMRPRVNTRMHCHFEGGSSGLSFVYKQETDGTVTPIIYDRATSRGGINGNQYKWSRASGGYSYVSGASY